MPQVKSNLQNNTPKSAKITNKYILHIYDYLTVLNTLPRRIKDDDGG